MPSFRLNKLVRDGVYDDQVATGQTPHCRKLSSTEHKNALIDKIIEEANELKKARDRGGVAAEIADLRQIIEDLVVLYGLSEDDITAIQEKRLATRGGFSEGRYVEILDVPDGDEWADYYRKEPDRFEEL